MSDLVAFLRARLDDEALFAREAHNQQWLSEEGYVESPAGSHVARFEFDSDARHAGCWAPSRVLVEVAAKRAILDLHAEHAAAYPDECAHCNRNESAWDTIRLLAQPFRDHPDFDPAWTEET